MMAALDLIDPKTLPPAGPGKRVPITAASLRGVLDALDGQLARPHKFLRYGGGGDVLREHLLQAREGVERQLRALGPE